jgi:hypothetical protein
LGLKIRRNEAGSDLLVAFPTKEQKEFMAGKIDKMPVRSIYEYWTNFDRRNPKSWEIYPANALPDWTAQEKEGYWYFKTNINPDDLGFLWDEKKVRTFLIRMWEIYRYRKVDHAISSSNSNGSS